MKITKKNRFYESRLSYKGGNDETLTRPENLNLNSRGAGGGHKQRFFMKKILIHRSVLHTLQKEKFYLLYDTCVTLIRAIFGGVLPTLPNVLSPPQAGKLENVLGEIEES